MKCPRCGEQNEIQNIKCLKCELSLKVICPRCKTLNPLGESKCLNCKLTLVHFCPKCKSANKPSAQSCRKCNFHFITLCKQCNTPNPFDKQACLKCSAPLKKEAPSTAQPEPLPVQPQVQRPVPKVSQSSPKAPAPKVVQKSQELPKYPILTVELINLSVLKTKIPHPEIVQKILKRFYKAVLTEAKSNEEKAIKISEQIVGIEFISTKNLKQSAYIAVNSAKNILKDINELNFELHQKLKIKLKVKIGIAVKAPNNKSEICISERSAANANEIVASSDIYNQIFNICSFEKVQSVAAKSKELYKVIDPLEENEPLAEQVSEETSEASTTTLPEEPPQEQVPINATIQEVTEAQPTEEVAVKEEEWISDSPVSLLIEENDASSVEIYNFLTQALTEEEQAGLIINIHGSDGSGKTGVIISTKQALENEKIFWLKGQCDNKPLPYSYFQDLFKSIFNLPILNTDVEQLKQQIAELLNKIGINDETLLNILYMLILNDDEYSIGEDLFQNSQVVKNAIVEFINIFAQQAKVVLVIEDFDYIDDDSFDCIKMLIQSGFLENKNFIISTYSSELNLSKYFRPYLVGKNIVKLNLKPMDEETLINMISGLFNGQEVIPTNVRTMIVKQSKGLPLYVDQVLYLLFQVGAIQSVDNGLKFSPQNLNFDLPDSVEKAINIRLSLLAQSSPELIQVLLCASLFGIKFMPAAIQQMVGVQQQRFYELIEILKESGIFVPTGDEYHLEFKHKLIWNLIYKQGFNDKEETETYHKKMLDVLSNISGISQVKLAFHLELSGNLAEAFDYWDKASMEAARLGALSCFTTCQSRVLRLIDVLDIENKDEYKLSINELLGSKINNYTNPELAQQFLYDAVMEREKRQDYIQMIDLAGHLSRCCEVSGSYYKVIDVADKAISKISKYELPLEYALLHYSKLLSLLNLGRHEEIISVTRHEVIPVIDEHLSKNTSIPGISLDELAGIKIHAELILTEALAIQGNKETKIITSSLISKLSSLEQVDKDTLLKAKLIDSINKLLRGEVIEVKTVIAKVDNEAPNLRDSNYLKIYSDLIYLIICMLEGKYDEASEISRNLLILTDLYNEHSLQSIIKMLIGKIYKEKCSYKKAKQIFREELEYCSENKLTVGALLGWYFSAEDKILESEIDQALDITDKALEVAQTSDKNNFIMSILLQKLIAEIYIIKGDFESALIYVERSFKIAHDNELYLLLSYVFMVNAKIYHEMATATQDNKQENVQKAYKFYSDASSIALKCQNDYLNEIINKELNQLNTFCQLSGIKL